MTFIARMVAVILLVATVATPCFASSRKSAGKSSDSLKQYVDDLKKNPSDNALREKIIKLGLSTKPSAPEDAERHFVRGTTFLQKASDEAGYTKAISELESALTKAPWMAAAYYNLGIAQEKAGLYAEALQSLKWYLLAEPDAKNAREVKNKIYALEADLEDIKASKNAPAPPVAAPPAATPGKLGVAGTTALDIEPAEAELRIFKIPPAAKKAPMPNFTGSWFFKEAMRGEEITIEAFTITKNGNGDLEIVPPKRAADSYASVSEFSIKDNKLKLVMKWKMRSVVGYWKNETYDLTMSADGKSLSGSHNQRSVGGRSIDMDRVLFRQ